MLLSFTLAKYAAVALVFCALAGLGTLAAGFFDRACQPPRLLRLPLLAIAGWALASLASALAALPNIDQDWLARGLFVLGLILLVPFGRSRAARLDLLCDLAVLLILVAPMGLLVASTPAMAFDEFAQWLPNSRYLVEHAHYWTWPDWIGVTSKPGYPNASAVIALLTSQLVGPDVEAPFKTFVVLLLGGFGAALAGLAARRFSSDSAPAWARQLSVTAPLAAGCLIAFLDPFMDPRIGFTAYTDTPSATIAAITVLAAAYGLGAARRGASAAATGWFGWAGLLSLTLILLRQTNLVLVAAIAGGCGLIALIRKIGALRSRVRWALLLVAPPALGDLIWQLHLLAARIGPDISPRPLVAWDWSAPITVARAFFGDRLAGNPLLGSAALVLAAVATGGGIVVWRRRGEDEERCLPPPRVLMVLTGIVSGCFVAFLAWSYIAVFSPIEVAAAASLWRYLSELGPMLVLAGGCILFTLTPRRAIDRRTALAVSALGALLLLLLPVVARSYYRLDCRFPDVAAARASVAQLRPALEAFAAPAPNRARLAVVNATMGDWMAYALAFDLRWPASDQLVRFRVRDEPLADSEAWAWDQGLDGLLDFRSLDRAALAGRRIVPAVSLLGRPRAKGDSWPVLAATQPRPLPSCAAWGR